MGVVTSSSDRTDGMRGGGTSSRPADVSSPDRWDRGSAVDATTGPPAARLVARPFVRSFDRAASEDVGAPFAGATQRSAPDHLCPRRGPIRRLRTGPEIRVAR